MLLVFWLFSTSAARPASPASFFFGGCFFFLNFPLRPASRNAWPLFLAGNGLWERLPLGEAGSAETSADGLAEALAAILAEALGLNPKA